MRDVVEVASDLRAVRDASYASPSYTDPASLAREAFSFLADPDAVLRDQLAYAVLANWITGGVLAEPVVRELLARPRTHCRSGSARRAGTRYRLRSLRSKGGRADRVRAQRHCRGRAGVTRIRASVDRRARSRVSRELAPDCGAARHLGRLTERAACASSRGRRGRSEPGRGSGSRGPARTRSRPGRLGSRPRTAVAGCRCQRSAP